MRKLLQRLFERPNAYNIKTVDPITLPRGLLSQYKSPFYYTPLIQLKTPSEEFAATMRLLDRKNKILEEDKHYMMEVIVAEYVKVYNRERQDQYVDHQANSQLRESTNKIQSKTPKNTQPYPVPLSNDPDAGYYKNYKCQSPTHSGVVDYMVFCNNFRNFVPILYFPTAFHAAGTIAACLWNLLRKPNNPYGYAIQTNGHAWQLIRISADMKLEKTCLYEAKSKFGKFYQDEYHQELVLGMIEEGLDLQKPEVRALKAVYDYVDEKRFSVELKDGEKDRPGLVSTILRKRIK